MRVFIDACCFFAAFYSPRGGSTLLLELARLGKLTVVTNVRVIQETCKNLKNKVGPDAVARFHRVIRSGLIEVVATPDATEAAKWEDLTHEKDCHVLASAAGAKADCLVTLDQKHLLTAKVRGHFPIPVKNPADFLTGFLPGG